MFAQSGHFAGPSGMAMQGVVLEEGAVDAQVGTNPLPGFQSVLAPSGPAREARSDRANRAGHESSAPSESSHNIDTEDDFTSTIPHLEKFYEQLAATAQLPERHGASASDWVLSVARSYRRLSNWKRRRGRLRALMRPPQEGVAGLSASAAATAGCLRAIEGGFSSNTDDSGYEAGYETDADESELSEWESGPKTGRHKRKFDALMHLTHLTMRLSVSERQVEEPDGPQDGPMPPPREPPLKTRALGTQPVGLRLSLPHGGSDAPSGDVWRVPELGTGHVGMESCTPYAMQSSEHGPC